MTMIMMTVIIMIMMMVLLVDAINSASLSLNADEALGRQSISRATGTEYLQAGCCVTNLKGSFRPYFLTISLNS